MPKKHVQAELEPHEYASFVAAARDAGLTLKEGMHEAVLSWVRQRRGADDPLFAVAGIGRGSKASSAQHDAIYLED